jgi:phosphoserine phosphatase
MKPSLANVEKCVSDPPQLTPGITELVAALHAKGVKVRLIPSHPHSHPTLPAII